jgi:hypothetical protein
LVVDPNTELTFTPAAQCLQSVSTKRSQVVEGGGCVEPDQARSSLLFNVRQFNDALPVH